MQNGRQHPDAPPPRSVTAAATTTVFPPKSPVAPALPAKGGRPRPPPPQPPRRRDRGGGDDDEDGDIHATVSLPPIAATSRHAAGRRRAPGMAVRSTPCSDGTVSPPVAPPRPESTISPWTRDIVRVSSPVSPVSNGSGTDQNPAVTPSSPCISLTTPRPGTDRNQNLYVDAPLKEQRQQQRRHHSPLTRIGSTQLPQSTKRRSTSPKSSSLEQQHPRLLSPSRLADLAAPSSVISSPSSSRHGCGGADGATLKKKGILSDFPSSSSSGAYSSGDDVGSYEDDPADSIICRQCGLCKCAACRAPRRLPERWLCGNTCHLSAASVVNGLSCMWLVRAAMYHFGKDVEESDKTKDPFDNPCSCSADHACARWACLAGASMVLPCLCCYLPMRCCVKGIEKVYERASSSGCRCEQQSQQQQQQQRQDIHQDHSDKCNSNGGIVVDEPLSISSSLASSPIGLSRNKTDSEKLLLR